MNKPMLETVKTINRHCCDANLYLEENYMYYILIRTYGGNTGRTATGN